MKILQNICEGYDQTVQEWKDDLVERIVKPAEDVRCCMHMHAACMPIMCHGMYLLQYRMHFLPCLLYHWPT